MKEEIRDYGRSLGFDRVGFCRVGPMEGHGAYLDWIERGHHASMSYLERHAPTKADPSRLLPEAKTAIAVSLNYFQDNQPQVGGPKIARYALGRDYHKVLRGKLKRLEGMIVSQAPDTVCRVCVDSAPLLERELAHKAGLGWFGKNTMLIDTKSGSWFFIGVLLTSLDLEPDQPATGACGTCTKCVEACPTGAITKSGDRWAVDARRCISYLTIEHKGEFSAEQRKWVGDWTFGCDVCQEVCPFNAARPHQPTRAAQTEVPDFKAREWPGLKQLSVVSHQEWDELTRGSAVRRAGHEGLKRNARACLENS